MVADRAIIVGNGPSPSSELLTGLLESGGLLLCAVVGDLDSADEGLRSAWPDTTWVRVDADDTGTDLLKILAYAIESGVRKAVLTGVTGGRTDHTLWNLGLLPAFAADLDLCVVDDDCLIRLIGHRISFQGPVGLKVSLCPLAGSVEGITTRGLRWPLQGEALIPGHRDGISNEVVDTHVEICVSGREPLLLVIQREGDGVDLDLIEGTTGASAG